MIERENTLRPAAPGPVIAEVRYSLPLLLAEVQAERGNRTLGSDHLSQQAVQSLFQARSTRHGKRRR